MSEASPKLNYESGRIGAPASLTSEYASGPKGSYGLPRRSDAQASGDEGPPSGIRVRRGSAANRGAAEHSESSLDSSRSNSDVEPYHPSQPHGHAVEKSWEAGNPRSGGYSQLPPHPQFSPSQAQAYGRSPGGYYSSDESLPYVGGGAGGYGVQRTHSGGYYYPEEQPPPRVMYSEGPGPMRARRSSWDARELHPEDIARFQSMSLDGRAHGYYPPPHPRASPRAPYFISDDESGYSSQGNCFSDGESYRYSRPPPQYVARGVNGYAHQPAPLSDDHRYFGVESRREPFGERQQQLPPQPVLRQPTSKSRDEDGNALPMPEDFALIFSKARHNKYKEVADMMDEGAPVDGRDEFGNTLLMVSCQNGHKKLAKVCLRRGADPNAQNHKGQTPLHFCFSFGYKELGEYLIERVGADPKIKNTYGLTCYEGLHPEVS